MDMDTVWNLLLWCTIINYGILLLWFIIFAAARDWLRSLHGQWFRLPSEQFDTVHYFGMALYKLGILLFNLVPLISLSIVA